MTAENFWTKATITICPHRQAVAFAERAQDEHVVMGLEELNASTLARRSRSCSSLSCQRSRNDGEERMSILCLPD